MISRFEPEDVGELKPSLTLGILTVNIDRLTALQLKGLTGYKSGYMAVALLIR